MKIIKKRCEIIFEWPLTGHSLDTSLVWISKTRGGVELDTYLVVDCRAHHPTRAETSRSAYCSAR